VERFVALSEEDVLQAKRLYLEHSAYDDMRSNDPIRAVDQRPNDPEETDPMYRVVAAPVIVNWEPPQGRRDCRHPTPASAVEDVESVPAEDTLPRRVRSRIGTTTQSGCFERTSSGTMVVRERSTLGDTRVVRAARITSSSTGTVVPGLCPPTAP
jgi:hypothetical protein